MNIRVNCNSRVCLMIIFIFSYQIRQTQAVTNNLFFCSKLIMWSFSPIKTACYSTNFVLSLNFHKSFHFKHISTRLYITSNKRFYITLNFRVLFWCINYSVFNPLGHSRTYIKTFIKNISINVLLHDAV